ncbi:CoA transferase subunit A [Clostridium swellfunianum]|uniref:CoA transferase subunit A n=1 Tax=Clostridium swellfunianum TaxID=1367462 RepID=UPI00202E2E67|nr:CoA transferase subunit A [Clostridium swellfunianum]
MIDKVITLEEAGSIVKDGDMVAFGGNVLHRAPMAYTRELIRQGKKELKVVKTAGAHEVDILCAAGCVQSVDAGFISYETEYGLANHYRKAVQSGVVKANEHACYTVISALRAAAYGVPFMAVKGLMYGDLLAYNDYFKVVEDPFSGEPITLVKALNPDVGVIHVQECDAKGNCRIYGPKFDDVLISRASKKLIVTTEQIVPESKMAMNAEFVDIPHFLVSAVVHVQNGAAPCSCPKKYDIDKSVLNKFIAMKDEKGLEEYLKVYEAKDRKTIGRRY